MVFEGAKYSIVTHLGINPVNGGIPLSDRSSSGIIAWSHGEVSMDLLMCEIYDIFLRWKSKKRGIIIIEYIRKYTIDISGFININPHIHPKWVIDE